MSPSALTEWISPRGNGGVTAAVCLLVAALALTAPAARAQTELDPRDPASYFDAMPVHPSAEPIRDLLSRTRRECVRIGEPCEPGAALLETLFGGSYRDDLPDFIVELEPGESGGKLVTSQPLLVFNRRLTPYLFGVEHLWILVFSPEPVPMKARLTTIRQREANPFSGLLTVAGVAGGEKTATVETVDVETELTWRPLTVGSGDGVLHLGSARLPVGQETVARLTLIPEVLDRVEFHSITGHVSNTRASRAAFAAALGATFDTDETGLGVERGDPTFNGYVLAKFYLPGLRPRLQVSPTRRSLFKPSVALAVGTNVTSDSFEEIVVGLSFGHLVGKTGVLLAGNAIRDAGGGSRRVWRVLLGFDFTF